jgi:hypothetical protein
MIGIFGNSGVLATHIGGLIPDNNAGQISAADVRESIVSTVVSINSIVSSGDFDSATPFVKNVRIKRTQGNSGTGHLIVESGITFSANNSTQYVAYPGPGSILHNTLDGKDIGDPHSQYVPISGTRTFTNNVGFSNHWINASGSSKLETTNGKGLQFTYISSSRENINVGSGTQFTFLNDKSVLNSSRGVAKAWIRFQGSGTGGDGSPAVLDAYNVSGIKKEDRGKFTIIFTSGILKDNNYVAIGHSNGRSTSSSREDFSENTVAMVSRVGDDAQKLRSVSFVVMGEDTGTYLDGIVNDLVIFGTEPGGSGNPPTVVINPNYTAY